MVTADTLAQLIQSKTVHREIPWRLAFPGSIGSVRVLETESPAAPDTAGAEIREDSVTLQQTQELVATVAQEGILRIRPQ